MKFNIMVWLLSFGLLISGAHADSSVVYEKMVGDWNVRCFVVENEFDSCSAAIYFAAASVENRRKMRTDRLFFQISFQDRKHTMIKIGGRNWNNPRGLRRDIVIEFRNNYFIRLNEADATGDDIGSFVWVGDLPAQTYDELMNNGSFLITIGNVLLGRFNLSGSRNAIMHMFEKVGEFSAISPQTEPTFGKDNSTF